MLILFISLPVIALAAIVIDTIVWKLKFRHAEKRHEKYLEVNNTLRSPFN